MTRFEIRREGGAWYVLERNPKKRGVRNIACYRYDDPAKAVRAAMQLNARLAERNAKVEERRALKAKGRAEALAAGNPFKVGQLFSHSWGYDQTNVEIYEIVAVGPRTVTYREIRQHSVPRSQGFMSERVGPCPGEYIGEPVTRTLQVWVDPFTGKPGKPYIPSPNGHGCMSEMNPEETTYNSWYA